MPLDQAQAAMVGDLEILKNKLKEQRVMMSKGFKRVESRKKEREEKRKELVLVELRAALKTLHEMDSELVKEMKSEVYDKKEAVENMDEKVKTLMKSVESSEEEEEELMRAAIKELTDQVAALQLEQFSGCLEFSVSTSPVPLAAAFKKVSSLIHLTSPAIDSKAWKLKVVYQGRESKYLMARVEGLSDNQTVTDLLLKKMEVRVVSASGEVLEKATLHSQVTRKLATRCSQQLKPPCFEVRVRRPSPAVVAFLHVSLLDRDIQGSPQSLMSRSQDRTLGDSTYDSDRTCFEGCVCYNATISDLNRT